LEAAILSVDVHPAIFVPVQRGGIALDLTVGDFLLDEKYRRTANEITLWESAI